MRIPNVASDLKEPGVLATTGQTLYVREHSELSPLVVRRVECVPECRALAILSSESWRDTLAAIAAASADSLKREQARLLAAKRRQLIARGWRRDLVDAVLRRQVVLGMTAEMVRMAWGEPASVNRTITRGGAHEQWVYGEGYYAYLDDGVVTGIQTSTERP